MLPSPTADVRYQTHHNNPAYTHLILSRAGMCCCCVMSATESGSQALLVLVERFCVHGKPQLST